MVSKKKSKSVTVRARKPSAAKRKQEEVLARIAALVRRAHERLERSFSKLIAIENRLIALETTIRPTPIAAARREPQVVNKLEPVVDPIPVGTSMRREDRVLAQPPTDYMPPPKPKPMSIDERREAVGSVTPDEMLARQGGWEQVLLDRGWEKVPHAAGSGVEAWLEPPTDKLQQNGRYVLGSAQQAAAWAGIGNPYG